MNTAFPSPLKYLSKRSDDALDFYLRQYSRPAAGVSRRAIYIRQMLLEEIHRRRVCEL
jgi:hypothetical protein